MSFQPDWEEVLVRPVLESAEPHPMVFLELLVRRAVGKPEMLPLFSETLEEMGAWYLAQAEGLQAVLKVRQMVQKGGDAA